MPRDAARPEPPRRPQGPNGEIRVDLKLIADMVRPGSRLLDVGCGDGELLAYLWRTKSVDGRGIEISGDGVRASVSRGLSVIQGDADTDLANYPADAFDYVVLSQTLQAVEDPKGVLDNLVRIGRHAIVSFPNFGYWRVRLALLLTGRMPVTSCRSQQWYDTPNIHLCTLTDFVLLCRAMGIEIERSLILHGSGRVVPMAPGRLANLLAEQAVFLLRRQAAPPG